MAKAWFKPKRYGYGAGLPCSWEGWVLLVGLFAAIMVIPKAVGAFAPPKLVPLLWFGITTALIIVFAAIARAKTEGGWRWRNGSK